jgi:hypothetical protein
MSSSQDLTQIESRIKNLSPERDDHLFDVVSGGLVRIFARLNQLEEAYARLGRRLAALEGPQPPRARADQPITSDGGLPQARTGAAPPPLPPALPKRGRGRPPGARNRLNNGHDPSSSLGQAVEART